METGQGFSQCHNGHCPDMKRQKQAKTLCKEVLTKHKVGTFSCPHHSPKPAVLAGCKSPAEQEKPLGNFNFSCSVPDRQISWLDL